MRQPMTTEKTRELFAAHGLRCTRQRTAVYQALAMSDSHPTADELYRRARLEHRQLSLATVYNTLDAFCEAGLCRRIPTTTGSTRYDADTSDHLHVQVTTDGRIRDVPVHLGSKLTSSLPRQVISEIERELGIRVERLSVQLFAQQRD